MSPTTMKPTFSTIAAEVEDASNTTGFDLHSMSLSRFAGTYTVSVHPVVKAASTTSSGRALLRQLGIRQPAIRPFDISGETAWSVEGTTPSGYEASVFCHVDDIEGGEPR